MSLWSSRGPTGSGPAAATPCYPRPSPRQGLAAGAGPAPRSHTPATVPVTQARGAPPSRQLVLVGAGPPSWTAPGGRAGPCVGARLTRLTRLTFLPTDELELLLQDGQRRVRARCNLTEGLSWGPFRGNVQGRASSPGQVEPVRSPSPCSPPACSGAVPGQRPPGDRPLLP